MPFRHGQKQRHISPPCKGGARGGATSSLRRGPVQRRSHRARPRALSVITHSVKRHKLLEPTIGHDDVVIEQHEVLAPRLMQPLVDRGRETTIDRIGDHGHRHGRGILQSGQIIGGAVGRAVVDDDELPGRARVAQQARTHCRVNSSWFQQGMMIDASPPIVAIFLVMVEDLRQPRWSRQQHKNSPQIDADARRLGTK